MRLILFLLLWLLSGYLYALPDDLRSALKEPLQVAWDNLEGGSEWLSGPPPRYRDGFHWVTLESAEKLSFRFYRHSAIRVMSKTNPSVEGISVAVSDGSGLFITLEPEQLADGTWLYTNPLEVPGIALINNTSPDSQYRRFALFTKREALSPAPEPYRHRINLDLPTISLSENDNHGGENFQRMLSGQQASVGLSGPIRLLVENRFHYAPDHDSTSADYRLSVQLDDEPASTLLFSTSPEYRRQIYVDGQPIVSGRSEKAVIEVPAGEHRLTFSADANILLRLRQMQTDDFLFPGLNRPMAWDKGLHSQNQTSQAVRQSQVLARSNRIRAGGLVAVDKLARLAAETAHNDISASIASLRNRHLLSRPLLPDTPATGIYSASFSTPRMLDRQESRTGIVASQHIDAQLKSLRQGYFHRLTSRHDYHLPERDADSLLRISVDASQLLSVSELSLQMDDLPPVKLSVNGQHRAGPQLQQIDIRRAALDQLSSTTATPVSLNGSLPDKSDRLTRVATIEIPLPASVKQVTLQHLKGPPVALALHYQDAAPFRVREDELLALLSELGTGKAACRTSPTGSRGLQPSRFRCLLL